MEVIHRFIHKLQLGGGVDFNIFVFIDKIAYIFLKSLMLFYFMNKKKLWKNVCESDK